MFVHLRIPECLYCAYVRVSLSIHLTKYYPYEIIQATVVLQCVGVSKAPLSVYVV